MTSVQSIGPNMQQFVAQPQYYPEVLDVKEFSDHYVYTIKDEASSGKKWGVGIGSFLFPGLGQAINGQWGKAAGMFAGLTATLAAPKLLKKTQNMAALSVIGLTNLGLRIWAAIDSVKNASSKTKQIVPKN